MKSKAVLSTIAFASSILLAPQASISGIIGGVSGVECQQEFQNNWQTTLPHVWAHCNGFKNAIGNVLFYYNLDGAEPYWEETLDYYEPEAVDLFYANTHGGAWAGRAVWAMWNQNSLASSNEMRLGDENRGLSILSTYACETLRHNGIVDRYRSIMRGGLRYTTGSHDKLYDSITTDEVGEDYANNLRDGDSIRYAWRDAVSDWWTSQDATVLTTGVNSSDCHNRRANMTWGNYKNYPRLRDSQVAHYCWTWWEDL